MCILCYHVYVRLDQLDKMFLNTKYIFFLKKKDHKFHSFTPTSVEFRYDFSSMIYLSWIDSLLFDIEVLGSLNFSILEYLLTRLNKSYKFVTIQYD